MILVRYGGHEPPVPLVWCFRVPFVATQVILPIPSLDIRTVGDGPKRTTAWLDGVTRIVEGFHEWPKVGESHLIDGLLYRLVEISDRWVWVREPQTP